MTLRTIGKIIEHLQGQAANRYLVAIDGGGGAGKSTLADEIARLVDDTDIVRMDDFYRVMDESEREQLDAAGGYMRYMDWQRVRRDVLVPLQAGRLARYQRYDWESNALAEWHEIMPAGLILVEGVGSLRPELRAYFDWTVYVAASEQTRLQRLVDRGHNSMEWIERWDAAERYYQELHKPMQVADVVVSGEE